MGKVICTCDADGLRWASLEALERVNDELYTFDDDDYDAVEFWGLYWIKREVA